MRLVNVVLVAAVLGSTCGVAAAEDAHDPQGSKAPDAAPAKWERYRQQHHLPGLPAAAQPSVNANNGIVKLDLPGPVDNSLWFRYFRAGEDAYAKNDPDKAKAYWLASLSAFEQTPPKAKNDVMLAVKLSALEQYLSQNAYPSDWSQFKDKHDEEKKLREEQVNTLYRIARINERYVRPDDLLRTKSKERYETARREYEKFEKTPVAEASSGSTAR